jgi:hypothetical protein
MEHHVVRADENVNPATSAVGPKRQQIELPLGVCAVRGRRFFQWVQAPPGDRSSRKQPEQAWRRRHVWCARKAGEFQPVQVRPG